MQYESIGAVEILLIFVFMFAFFGFLNAIFMRFAFAMLKRWSRSEIEPVRRELDGGSLMSVAEAGPYTAPANESSNTYPLNAKFNVTFGRALLVSLPMAFFAVIAISFVSRYSAYAPLFHQSVAWLGLTVLTLLAWAGIIRLLFPLNWSRAFQFTGCVFGLSLIHI